MVCIETGLIADFADTIFFLSGSGKGKGLIKSIVFIVDDGGNLCWLSYKSGVEIQILWII